MAARRALYASRPSMRLRPPVPVISVGNLAWGGAGKTPVTQTILTWAVEREFAPAVVSRGYGGNPPGHPFEVGADSPAEHSGDEPLLLKRAVPEAMVIADPNRPRGCELAQSLGADLIVLDDGFQRLDVARDVDLVLLRPEDLPGEPEFGRVCPAGSWREGVAALSRASALLYKAPLAPLMESEDPRDLERTDKFRALARELGVPGFVFRLAPARLTRIGGQPAPLPEGDYALACGVAQAWGPAQTAEAFFGRPAVSVMAYGDHHEFTARDVAAINNAARALNASVVVTAKDAVKLARFPLSAGFFMLQAEARFDELAGETPFFDWLAGEIERATLALGPDESA